MAEMSEVKRRLEELMRKVEMMERGGDLEKLLEEEVAVLKKELYETALRTRQNQSAEQADFSPSGMPKM